MDENIDEEELQLQLALELSLLDESTRSVTEPGVPLLAKTTIPDGKVQLWKADSMELVGTLDGHRGVRRMCFSDDGSRIATGSHDMDDSIRVWNTQTRELVGYFHGVGHIMELQFNRAGNLLLAVSSKQIGIHGGYRMALNVWSLGTHQEIMNLNHMSIGSAMFSTDGECVVAVFDNILRVVAIASKDTVVAHCIQGVRLISLLPHPGYCYGLLAASVEGVLSLRNVISKDDVVATFAVSSTNSRVCYNSEGSKLAISSGHGVEIWDVGADGVLVGMVVNLAATEPVYSMSFSSTSERVVVVSSAKSSCQIFAIPSGELIYSTKKEKDQSGEIIAVYQQNFGVVLM